MKNQSTFYFALFIMCVVFEQKTSFAQLWSSSGNFLYPTNTSNNVSIGTSTNSATLFVKKSGHASVGIKSGNATATLYLDKSTATTNAEINFKENGNAKWKTGLIGSNDYQIIKEGASVPNFVISQSGNIGIDTINPTTKLSINHGGISIKGGSIYLNNEDLQPQWGLGKKWKLALQTFHEVAGGQAWRMETETYGSLHRYIGYGMATNVGGWYWISSLGKGTNDVVYYPMLLRVDEDDVAGGNLELHGKIKCTEVEVKAKWWDDVFNEDYYLRSISEVKAFITMNKHLPDVTPGSIIESEGLNLGEASSQLIRKMEENTLYLIDHDERIEKLEMLVENLLIKNQELEQENEFLKAKNEYTNEK